MDRTILTTEVSKKSWILSKRSLRYELKVHAPERERAIQHKALGNSEWRKTKLSKIPSGFRLPDERVTHTLDHCRLTAAI